MVSTGFASTDPAPVGYSTVGPPGSAPLWWLFPPFRLQSCINFQERTAFSEKDPTVLIGYARISTVDQNLDLQRDALKAAGCHTLFEDKISGTKTQRLGLDKALTALREGDVLVWYFASRSAGPGVSPAPAAQGPARPAGRQGSTGRWRPLSRARRAPGCPGRSRQPLRGQAPPDVIDDQVLVVRVV